MGGFKPITPGADSGSSVPTDNFSGGYFDYNDLGTTASPIAIIGGGADVVLTNDEAGFATIKLFPPNGVTDVWDATAGEFDWSELSVGDEVAIRLDISLITTSQNTEITVELHLAGGVFSLPWITETNFKSTGTHRQVIYNKFHLATIGVVNGNGEFKINADKNCDVIVNGWYCSIRKRG